MHTKLKILFPDWKNFGVDDIKEAFEKMGHEVIIYKTEPKNYRIDPRFKSELKKYIRANEISFMFTSNYFPVVADACHEINIPYISWCYDSPLVLTFSKTIFYPTNFIFIFDSKMVADLQKLGAKQVFYMPMAVNPARLDKLHATPEQKELINADVSFVGSLYSEKHTLYDRMTNLDEYTKGYIDGVMKAQEQLYGASIVEAALTPPIIDAMYEKMPINIHEDDLETKSYVYANYFINRKITQTERPVLLKEISEALPEMEAQVGRRLKPLKLYTHNPTPFLPKVENMGTIHYMKEMPLVFRHSKINLNITLRSIINGIPLRAMDIMGAGGFLLTNYQNDFQYHFEDGKDYVSFYSKEDMLDKIAYYLEHEEERKQIAKNGKEKVCTEHTYDIHLKEMLDLVFENTDSVE